MASGMFIVAAKRTPFGTFGGSLRNVTATQLGVLATRAALQELDPSALSSSSSSSTTTTTTTATTTSTAAEWVDSTIFGNVIPSSIDAAYLARHVSLHAGIPIAKPAVTINRLCGSGFESVVQAVQQIQCSRLASSSSSSTSSSSDPLLAPVQIVVAGGTENMSMAPLQVLGNQVRWEGSVPLGAGLTLRDTLWDGLTDHYQAHAPTPMGITAENLAKQYHVTREECDRYAVQSQQRWWEAHQAQIFRAEIVPVHHSVLQLKRKKGGGQQEEEAQVFDTDEHARPQTSLDKIAKLPPVFLPKGEGVVTAANASGISDGAGAIIVASEEACQTYNLKPLARIVSYGITGCEPTKMGIGPVTAIQQALRKANLTLDQMDRVEINEAFAAQVLACAKELNLDHDRLNIHGGAIALGHPLAASGSRIVAHLSHALAKPNNPHRYYVGSACIGGGQGIALILEKV